MKNKTENVYMVKNTNRVSTSAHETSNNITKGVFLAMYLMCLSHFLYCQINTTTVSTIFEKEQHVYQMQNLNPVVPGYAADASIFYDEKSAYYYVFATNDGNSGKNTWPTQFWYSKDLINWEHQNVELPEEWFKPENDYKQQPHDMVWAPSVVYNPQNKKYYITYTITDQRIAMSNSLFGPWVDANKIEPNKPFMNGHDGQFFLDDDGSIYLTLGAREFNVVKLAFDEDGKVYADDSDPRMTYTSNRPGNPFKYAKTKGIKNAFEASEIFKRNGLYYLLWSYDGGPGYNVRYAVSEDVLGPYRELNESYENPILSTNDSINILGPGHHSIFTKNGQYYIVYHRQHYPFVDSKRQTCIDELNFNEDGSIKKVTPTHTGVKIFENPDKRVNIALGKQTRVSSARTYFPTRYSNVNFRYEGNFAVDENGGTRWDAGLGSTNPWLLVDLGSESTIDAVQTLFEFTNKKYMYTIEYLQQKDASNIDDAVINRKWQVYADKSVEGTQFSPVEDTFAEGGSVNARYLRITIFRTEGIPETAEPGNKINGDNAVSIFEFKVFGSQTSNDLNRILEAENFNGQSGIQLEASAVYGINICSTNNNDFILYKDINLGNGAKTVQAGIAVGPKGGGKIDIRIDTVTGELIGSVETKNTGGWQTWKTVTADLSGNAKGKHDIYIIFKADNDTERVANIDWLKFCTI